MVHSDAKLRVSQLIRRCSASNVLDRSGKVPAEAAIYVLTDPRDLQAVRYVGQTRSPSKRYSQHLRTAKLWLPDELPWWIKEKEMRPLYQWLRELYRDEFRLPIMSIMSWTGAAHVRKHETAHIEHYLAQQLPLLNREARIDRRQLALSLTLAVPADDGEDLASDVA